VLVDPAPGALSFSVQVAGSDALGVPVTSCIDEATVTLAPNP
jgi:hypothetical protein